MVGVDEGRRHEPDAPSLAALRWAFTLPGVEEVQVAHADFVPGVAAGPVREPGVESDEETTEDDAGAAGDHQPGHGRLGCGAERCDGSCRSSPPAPAPSHSSRPRLEADLVVIGTRGRRGLVELITGSTGLDVTAHAHCPVAVVH